MHLKLKILSRERERETWEGSVVCDCMHLNLKRLSRENDSERDTAGSNGEKHS